MPSNPIEEQKNESKAIEAKQQATQNPSTNSNETQGSPNTPPPSEHKSELKTEQKPATASIKQTTQTFLARSENTMSELVQNPVWVYLLKLQKLLKITQQDLDNKVEDDKGEKLRNKYLSAFQKFIAENHPEDKALQTAFDYLEGQLNNGTSDLDQVPTHLIEEKTRLPLKHVFALVYSALTDDKYCVIDKTTGRPAPLKDRLNTLCNAIKILHQKRVCHVGIRNDLAHTMVGTCRDLINDSKEAIYFIDDIHSFLHRLIIQKIQRYFEKLKTQKVKVYHKSMLKWVSSEDGMPKNIYTFLNVAKENSESNKSNIFIHLEQKLQVMGIPTNNETIQKHIEDRLSYAALQYIKIPLTEGNPYYWVYLLFNQNEESNDEARDNALHQLKRKIKTSLTKHLQTQPDPTKQFIEQLECFLKIDNAFLLQQKHGTALRAYSVEMKQLAEATIKVCEDFYHTKFSTESKQKSNSLTFAQLQLNSEAHKVLDKFLTKTQYFLKENHVSWVESFFKIYQTIDSNDDSDDEKNSDKERLYTLLLDLNARGKICVSDDWLNEIKSKNTVRNQAAGQAIFSLGPYEVNRITLHAILTPRKEWTNLFIQTYTKVIEQLQGNKFKSHLTRQFRDQSYPKALQEQLCFLRDAKSEMKPGYLNGKKPVIPMLYLPVNTDEFIFILKKLPKPQVTQYLTRLDKGILRHNIRYSIDITQALKNLEPQSQSLFLKILGDVRTNQLINDRSASLTFILKHLAPKLRPSLLFTTIEEKKLNSAIGTGYDLLGILELINFQSRSILLNQLSQEKLKQIITCGYVLRNILKIMPPALNYFLLFTVLDRAILLRIICDAKILCEIITLLDPKGQYLLLQLLGKVEITERLLRFSGYSLGFKTLLLKLDKKQQENLLKILGVKPLKRFIKTCTDLSHILPALKAPELINCLGKEILKKFISSPNELATAFSELKPKRKLQFFTILYRRYRREVLGFLDSNPYDRHLVLINLEIHKQLHLFETNKNESDIDKGLLTIFIRNVYDLIPFLNKAMCNPSTIFNILGKTELKKLIQNVEQLNSIYDVINSERFLLFKHPQNPHQLLFKTLGTEKLVDILVLSNTENRNKLLGNIENTNPQIIASLFTNKKTFSIVSVYLKAFHYNPCRNHLTELNFSNINLSNIRYTKNLFGKTPIFFGNSLQEQKHIFDNWKLIYKAMREKQHSLWNPNFIENTLEKTKESKEDQSEKFFLLKQHIDKEPVSRSAQAFKIAKEYPQQWLTKQEAAKLVAHPSNCNYCKFSSFFKRETENQSTESNPESKTSSNSGSQSTAGL